MNGNEKPTTPQVKLEPVIATIRGILPPHWQDLITKDFVFDGNSGIDSLTTMTCFASLEIDHGIELSEKLVERLMTESLGSIFESEILERA